MKKLLAVLSAIVLVAAFTVPAMADWDFYGSARMTTFWEGDDDGGVDSDTDWDATWNLQGNARIGATVKNGDIGGGFEYGSGPNLRKLYGTYDFGAGQLLIGQTYTPCASFFYSNQVWGDDEDLLGIGQFYNGRDPMIQLKLGGFKVALVSPQSTSTAGVTGAVDTDIIFPQLEMSYGFKTEVFFLDVFTGIHSYDIVAGTGAAEKDYSVTGWVGGLGLGFNAGPFYLKTGGFISINGTSLGAWGPGASNSLSARYNAAQDDIEDVNSMGGLLVLGIKAGDAATIEGGLGYIANEYDTDVANQDNADETMSVYVNATINITDGFFIVPEIGYIDWMDNYMGVDQGDKLYFGAKWQINF